MGRKKKEPDANHMTEMQTAVFQYLKAHVKEKNYAPSVRDICRAVGLKSTSSVFSYLNDLEAMGLIRKDPTHPRAIQILGLNQDAREEGGRELVQVPLLGTVAAGQPIFAEENITDYYPIPVDMLPNQRIFMLNVKGDSMINCGILSGDRVIVAQQNSCENGEIVVALIDDSATVKRFYREKDYIRLQPENDSMSPILVENCEILGKVIGLIRMGLH